MLHVFVDLSFVQNIVRELSLEEKLAEREIREAEDFILGLRNKRSDGALRQDNQAPSFLEGPIKFFKSFLPPVQIKIGS